MNGLKEVHNRLVQLRPYPSPSLTPIGSGVVDRPPVEEGSGETPIPYTQTERGSSNPAPPGGPLLTSHRVMWRMAEDSASKEGIDHITCYRDIYNRRLSSAGSGEKQVPKTHTHNAVKVTAWPAGPNLNPHPLDRVYTEGVIPHA